MEMDVPRCCISPRLKRSDGVVGCAGLGVGGRPLSMPCRSAIELALRLWVASSALTEGLYMIAFF